MSLSAKYGYTPDKEAIDRQLALIAQNLENIASEDLYKACFGIMDQTTLSSDDTPASVRKMVEKVNGIPAAFPGWPLPASVCVYPNLGHVVAETRKDPALHVTTVAGCFPTSQSWIEVKLQEIELAVRGGADEIDIVLALNSFLAGDYETAGAEIKASRECIDRVAKELGIAVGTLYNYFSSKEYLAACVMLEDWQARIHAFEAEPDTDDASEVIRRLFETATDFTSRYRRSWVQYEEHDRSESMRDQYHKVLVRQLGSYISAAAPGREEWLTTFLAEMVLRFGSDGHTRYEDIEKAVNVLLEKT